MNQLGIDYASVDENVSPDAALARTMGLRFVYLRKSYPFYDRAHTAWHLAPDKHYERDAQKWRDANVVVGAYGFYSFARGAPSMAEQFANFVAAPGDVVAHSDLPPCIDVEFPGNGIADTRRSPAEVFAMVLELVALHRAHYKCSPAIYTSHVEWHDDNGLRGPDDPALDDVVLWQKTPYRLRANQPVDQVAPLEPHLGKAHADPNDYYRIPRPWEDQGYWLHQFQGDALGFPGMSHTVDVNHFNVLTRATMDAPRVKWLQRHLNLVVTGTWDDATAHAVEAFQASRGLVADGVVGLRTFCALAWT